MDEEKPGRDSVQLAEGVERWPVELAERMLASPLPWGNTLEIFGGSNIYSDQTNQAEEFVQLAHCVNGGYKRHGDIEAASRWVSAIIDTITERESCADLSTQDILDVVFLACRGDLFSEGLICSLEPGLRVPVGEVVKRVRSDNPPRFQA